MKRHLALAFAMLVAAPFQAPAFAQDAEPPQENPPGLKDPTDPEPPPPPPSDPGAPGGPTTPLPPLPPPPPPPPDDDPDDPPATDAELVGGILALLEAGWITELEAIAILDALGLWPVPLPICGGIPPFFF